MPFIFLTSMMPHSFDPLGFWHIGLWATLFRVFERVATSPQSSNALAFRSGGKSERLTKSQTSPIPFPRGMSIAISPELLKPFSADGKSGQ